MLVWFFCVYPPIKNISTTFFLYCTLHKTIYAEICRMHQYWGYSGKFCIIIKKTLSLSVSLSVCLSLPVSSSKYFRDHLQSVANSAINYNKCTNWIYISSNYSNACAAEFIASSGEWNKCLPFLSLCFHSLSHLFALLIPNSERVVINHVDFLTNGCTKDNENIYKKTTVFQQHQRINAEKYHYPTHIEFL